MWFACSGVVVGVGVEGEGGAEGAALYRMSRVADTAYGVVAAPSLRSLSAMALLAAGDASRTIVGGTGPVSMAAGVSDRKGL